MPIDPLTGLTYMTGAAPNYGNSEVNYNIPGTAPPFTTTGRGANDPGGFLSSLYTARPAFVQQQGQLLSGLAPQLRQSLLSSIPELGQLSQFLTSRFSQPIPRALEKDFAERLRTAQAARGFVGGTGPASEEARFLTALAEQQRTALAPQLAAFGQQTLGNIGLAGPPDITLAGLGSLLFGQRQFEAELTAARRSDAFSQQLLNQFGGGGSSVAGGGAAGGGTPDFFSRLSGSASVGGGAGGGTADFFSRNTQAGPGDTFLYQQTGFAQGSRAGEAAASPESTGGGGTGKSLYGSTPISETATTVTLRLADGSTVVVPKGRGI